MNNYYSDSDKCSGILLRSMRETRKWNQNELAHQSDLSQSEISKLERGAAHFSAGIIAHLCKAFQLKEDVFYTQLNVLQIQDFKAEMNRLNNEEAAFVFRYFIKLNSSQDESERINYCKELIAKLDEAIQRKKSFMELISVSA